MTPSRRGPLPWSGLLPLAAGLTAVLFLTGCSGVPDPVDDFARGWGVALNPDRTDITGLAVGDCFLGVTESVDEATAVTTVDCAEEHDAELLHVVVLPESVTAYPGDEDELAWVEHEEQCIGPVFEDYVGEPFDTSSWDIYTFRPTEPAWASGDRTVQCVVYSMDGPLWTGSPSTGDAVVTPFDDSDAGDVGDTGGPVDVAS